MTIVFFAVAGVVIIPACVSLLLITTAQRKRFVQPFEMFVEDEIQDEEVTEKALSNWNSQNPTQGIRP